MGIWMLIYGFHFKKLSIPILAITGCGSMFCLVVSPVIGGRTALPFIFFLFLLIAIFTVELLKEARMMVYVVFILFLFPLGTLSALSFNINYNGYLNNYNIEKLNHEILIKHSNTTDKEITLYKSKDSGFGVARGYEEPSITYWMKEYYNIPQDVVFNWVDIYEDIRE